MKQWMRYCAVVVSASMICSSMVFPVPTFANTESDESPVQIEGSSETTTTTGPAVVVKTPEEIERLKPSVEAVKESGHNNQEVIIWFSGEKGIDKNSAEDVDNYAIELASDGSKLELQSARAGYRNSEKQSTYYDMVVLTTDQQVSNQEYNITIKDIESGGGDQISMDDASDSFTGGDKDENKPTVEVDSVEDNKVILLFHEENMLTDSYKDLSNYAFTDPSLMITKAELQKSEENGNLYDLRADDEDASSDEMAEDNPYGDEIHVVLTVNGLQSGHSYALTVSNVKDNYENKMDSKELTIISSGLDSEEIEKIRPKVSAIKASGHNNQEIIIWFDGEAGIDKDSAEDVNNYRISLTTDDIPLPIESVRAGYRNSKQQNTYYDMVVVTTAPQLSNHFYNIGVSDVESGGNIQYPMEEVMRSFLGGDADVNKPTVEVESVENNKVTLLFTEENMLTDSYKDVNNYVFSDSSLSITSIELQEEEQNGNIYDMRAADEQASEAEMAEDNPHGSDILVVLSVEGLQQGENYALTVSNVMDNYNNVMDTTSLTVTTKALSPEEIERLRPSVSAVKESGHNNTEIIIWFDGEAGIDQTSAEDRNNYVITKESDNSPLWIASAKAGYRNSKKQDSHYDMVVLDTELQESNEEYNISISGITSGGFRPYTMTEVTKTFTGGDRDEDEPSVKVVSVSNDEILLVFEEDNKLQETYKHPSNYTFSDSEIVITSINLQTPEENGNVYDLFDSNQEASEDEMAEDNKFGSDIHVVLNVTGLKDNQSSALTINNIGDNHGNYMEEPTILTVKKGIDNSSNKPYAISANANDANIYVNIKFSDTLDPISAGNKTNYSCDGLEIVSAQAIKNDDDEYTEVQLVTNVQTEDQLYYIAIENVKNQEDDLCNNHGVYFTGGPADGEAPEIEGPALIDGQHYIWIQLSDDNYLKESSVEDLSNYEVLTGDFEIESAVLVNADDTFVRLRTKEILTDGTYNIRVSNIKDVFDNVSSNTVVQLKRDADLDISEASDYLELSDLEVECVDSSRLRLSFVSNSLIKSDSLLNTSRYEISNGVSIKTINNIAPAITDTQPSNNKYILEMEVDRLNPGTSYTLSINDFESTSGKLFEAADKSFLTDDFNFSVIEAVAASAHNNNEVIVWLNKANEFDDGLIKNINNYKIKATDNSESIEIVKVQEGYRNSKLNDDFYDMVVLITSVQTEGKNYTLTVEDFKTGDEDSYSETFIGGAKDTTAPILSDVKVVNYQTLELTFEEANAIDIASVLDTANYLVDALDIEVTDITDQVSPSNPYDINDAAILPTLDKMNLKRNTSKTYTLEVTELENDESYTLTAKSIADEYGNSLASQSNRFRPVDLVKPVDPLADQRPVINNIYVPSNKNDELVIEFGGKYGIDAATAKDITNYQIIGLTIKSASVGYINANTQNTYYDKVTLKMTPQQKSKRYTLQILYMISGSIDKAAITKVLEEDFRGEKEPDNDSSSDSSGGKSSGKSGGSSGGGGGGGGGKSSSNTSTSSPDNASIAKVDKAKKDIIKKAGQLNTKEDIKAFISDSNEFEKVLKNEIQTIRSEKSALSFAATNQELFDTLAENVNKVETTEEKQEMTKAVAKNINTTKDVLKKIHSPQKVEAVATEAIKKAGALRNELTTVSPQDIDAEVVALAEEAVNRFNVKKVVAGKTATIKNTDIESIIQQSNEMAEIYNTTLSDNNIDITKPIEQKIKIDLSSSNVVKQNIVIDKIGINRMDFKNIDALVLETKAAKVEVPVEVLKDMNKKADVTFNVNNVDQSNLTPEQQKQVGQKTVFEFRAFAGEDTFTEFNQPIHVTVPYEDSVTDPSQVVVYYLKNDNTLESMAGVYDEFTKTVSFKTNHFSRFIVKESAINYVDLKTYPWAEKQIKSLAAKEIMTGTSNYTFAPYGKMTVSEVQASINHMTQTSAITVQENKSTDSNSSLDELLTNQKLVNLMCKALTDNGYKIVEVFDEEKSTQLVPVLDYNASAFATITREGLTDGLLNQSLVLENEPSKGEVAVMLFNLYNRLYD